MRCLFVMLVVSGLFSSCASVLPLNHSFEKAGTLGEGGVEISGHVAPYEIHHFDRWDRGGENYGFRVGYGMSDRFDLKLRYDRMNVSPAFDGRLRSTQAISFIPKFAAVPQKLALLMPFTHYTNRFDNGYRYKEELLSVAPQFLYTFTNRKQRIDLTLGSKTDIIFGMNGADGNNLFFGAHVGAGFSTDLRKWAIRPEIGVSGAPDETFMHYGLAIQIFLRRKN